MLEHTGKAYMLEGLDLLIRKILSALKILGNSRAGSVCSLCSLRRHFLSSASWIIDSVTIDVPFPYTHNLLISLLGSELRMGRFSLILYKGPVCTQRHSFCPRPLGEQFSPAALDVRVYGQLQSLSHDRRIQNHFPYQVTTMIPNCHYLA